MNSRKQQQSPFVPSLIVESLDPTKDAELETLLKSSKLIICDVDYTIIDISKGHEAGVTAIESITNFALASRFNQIFQLIVEGHRRPETADWEDRQTYNGVLRRMHQIQSHIVPQWGLKYWSKETMLLMAAKDVQYKFDANSLIQVRDAYWKTRTENSLPYPYVAAFCDTLVTNHTILDLFTSSYHIMQIAPDLSLTYNPEKSKQYKQAAIQPHLPEMTHSIIIGDPVDKPSAEFFATVLQQITLDLALKETASLNFSSICAIGDSLRNDLEFLGSLGCKTILVKHA